MAIGAVVLPSVAANAATDSLTIESIEWNVVGVGSTASNATTSPYQYAVGADVCNISAVAVTDVALSWNWLTANANISIDGSLTKTVASIAAGECVKRWWTVELTRSSASWNAKRSYTITASAFDVNPVTTPLNREIYVEKFIAQSRNGVDSLAGPTNVFVGQTVQYTMTGHTSTGYSQLYTGTVLDGSIFEVLSVASSFTNPGGTSDEFYTNACGWESNTTSPDYRSCVGPEEVVGGIAGGDLSMVVTALVIGTGTGRVGAIINDYSGSSYHYAADSNQVNVINVTSTAPVVTVAPVANPDSSTTVAGMPVAIDVAANDTDADGDLAPSTVTKVTPPANGTITAINVVTGVVTYEPNAGFTGTDTFTYQICDAAGDCDTALVTIVVSPAPSAPVADDDVAETTDGVAVVVDVLANDFDIDGDLAPATVEITGAGPLNGGWAINAVSGAITYTPNPGFTGTETFTYQVCDAGGRCDNATVSIAVTTIPVAPVAVDDGGSTSTDVPVTIDILANDSDADGDLDPTSVTKVVPPTNGSVEFDPVTGVAEYTPAPGFTGNDSFTYSVCDLGDRCASAEVLIAVGSTFVAVDDTATTTAGVQVVTAVLDNDVDSNNNIDPASVAVVSPPANGSTTVNATTGAITYLPNVGFSGVDTFTYQVCDADGLCPQATVTVTVNAAPSPPIADDDVASTLDSVAVVIDVLSNDADADLDLDPTSVSIQSRPSNGNTAVNPSTGAVTYTPNPSFTGTDSFTYRVCDRQAPPECDVALVSIAVATGPQAPMANDDAASTAAGVDVVIPVLDNDTDGDGDLDPSSVEVTIAALNGSTSRDPLTGAITYTPNPGFSGSDSFVYSVCDSQPICDTATVSVTIAAAPRPPVAGDDSETTGFETAIEVDVLGNDTDPDGDLDPNSVQVTIDALNGTTSRDPLTGAITYTPDAGFSGSETIEYEVCDLTGLCDTAQLLITVNSGPTGPVAVDDSSPATAGVAVTVDVLLNDSDVDGDLDYTSASIFGAGPLNGAVSVDRVTGEITYTANAGFTGIDTFDYEVCDSRPVCSVATVVMTVSAAPSAPVAVNNWATTTAGMPAVIRVADNDSDADGDLDPTSLRVVAPPSNGDVVFNLATLAFTYTPDPGFIGVDSFSYEICDLQPVCTTAVVTLLISPAALAFTGANPWQSVVGAFILLLFGFGLMRRKTFAASSR